MKASELRAMSGDDLGKTLLTLREAQFKMRMQKATGELGQTHFLQQNQRDIARVKTLLTEKAGGYDVCSREACKTCNGQSCEQ